MRAGQGEAEEGGAGWGFARKPPQQLTSTTHVAPGEPGIPWDITGHGPQCLPKGWAAGSRGGLQLLVGVVLAACHTTRG